MSERVSMPDFDIDFCYEGRSQVIDYVLRKYGSERVGQIITFGSLKARAVIRDVARVLDLPYAEADAIADGHDDGGRIEIGGVARCGQRPQMRFGSLSNLNAFGFKTPLALGRRAPVGKSTGLNGEESGARRRCEKPFDLAAVEFTLKTDPALAKIHPIHRSDAIRT